VGENYVGICERAAGPDQPQAQAVAAAIRAALQGRSFEGELEYPCHSPTVQRWFAVRITHFEQQGAGRVVVAHEDITARRLAEAARRASDERYRRIVETAHEGVFSVDPAGRVTFANARLLELVGADSQDILHRFFTDYVAPESRPAVARQLAAASTAPAGPEEVVLQRADGELLIVLLSASRLTDGGELPGDVLGMVADITEYRQTQEQLQRVVRLASLGTLAAGIAHEINNPIGGVVMAARNALSAPPGSPETRELLEEIIREAKRCAAVIHGVLQFARHGSTERLPHDVNELAQRAVELARNATSSRELHVTLELAPDLPLVPLHVVALQQALLNLIRNAIDAGGPQTQITIRTALADERHVSVTVQDEGPGIAPEVLPRLFDPFFTLRAGRGGTGLGLSIVHTIMEAHGGRVEVTSTPGRGTQFKLLLPLAGAGADCATAPAGPV
jgi:PAS domain S-box-containing protein